MFQGALLHFLKQSNLMSVRSWQALGLCLSKIATFDRHNRNWGLTNAEMILPTIAFKGDGGSLSSELIDPLTNERLR